MQWWNTLHQPDSITLTGAPTMALSMLWPLLVATLGLTLGFAAIVLARLRASVMETRLRSLLPGAWATVRQHSTPSASACQARLAGRTRLMTHLPFVAAAYGLTLAVALALSVGAATRLARARRRLAAIDPRESRG